MKQYSKPDFALVGVKYTHPVAGDVLTGSPTKDINGKDPNETQPGGGTTNPGDEDIWGTSAEKRVGIWD